jgi:hypothetical protein
MGFRQPNTEEGHAQPINFLAAHPDVMVYFEATGGQEWRLWAALDAVGIATANYHQLKSRPFAASRGHAQRRSELMLGGSHHMKSFDYSEPYAQSAGS